MNPHPQTAEPTPAPVVSTEPVPQGTRGAQLALVVFFVSLIAAGPVLQAAYELKRGQPISALEVFRTRPTSANLRAYEDQLEEASVLARALRPWFQFAQFTWLRDGGEKALIGRDGWLYYKPGFDDLVARVRKPETNDPAAAIIAFRDQLAARGIQLLVVPTPNKESIYPEKLTRRVQDGRAVMAPSTRELMERLKAGNVAFADLFTVFAEARTNAAVANEGPLYLKQDSHWSPAGVTLAARAVASQLIEKGWVKSGSTDYRGKPAPVERLGDVVRMLQSARIESSMVPEKAACVQVFDAGTGQLYENNADSEVLVLGDSFLRIYQKDEPGAAGFVAHFAKELKQPVASIINDGGASTLVRQELHRRPGLLKNKKVVVWEFVERDIRLGTEGWQPVPLPE